MNCSVLLVPVLLPAALAIVCLGIPARSRFIRDAAAVIGSIALLYYGVVFFVVKDLSLFLPWTTAGGFSLALDFRLYPFSAFILLWITVFTALVILYSTVKMSSVSRSTEYYTYIFLTAAFASGAVLSNNLILLVFFWEGLLLTLYGLITIGGKNSYKTALKSLLIVGFCDFCMILGIVLLWTQTRTFRISDIAVRPEGVTAVSFILMSTGALGKAGALPFHTWIPDAAIDAPVSVMALLPGAMEKLLGVYLLTRICLDIFVLEINSSLCIILMTVGAVTIVVAVLMALVQKDLKRLLSYHAISQFGYMVLGVGTGVPLGIAGGIFHMLNNAIYKSGLFLGAGSVEHRAGTTEMKKLGGLGREMPVTAVCFLVLSAAISGIWPLNGFVSKEMIFHGSKETGYIIFTIAAWVGAIFTFASFLKASHSVFLGPRSSEIPQIRETGSPMFIPLIILTLLSVVFGIFYNLPLKLFIIPVLQSHSAAELESFNGLALFNPFALVSVLCLCIGFAIHCFGWLKSGKKAYMASEPVHQLPVLEQLYDRAEKRIFDPYDQGVKLLKALAAVLYYGVDRVMDFCFDGLWVMAGRQVVKVLRFVHNGIFANYLAWALTGLAAVAGLLYYLVRGGLG